MDMLTLQWAGIADAHPLDYIAIFAPSTATRVMGWRNVTDSPSWQTGSGSISLPLVNMRTDYRFAYVSGTQSSKWGELLDLLDNTNTASRERAPNAWQDLPIIATSNNVTFESADEPLQGHIAYPNDPTQMRVQWTSSTFDEAAPPTVRYGTDPNHLESSATGGSDTYTVNDVCGEIAGSATAWMAPGQLNDVLLTGLAPATQYFYQFGTDATGFSDVFTFFSAPAVESDTETNLVVFGDLGVALPFITLEEQMPPSLQTASGVLGHVNKLQQVGKPCLLFHNGDVSYARGWGYLWEYFMDLIQPIASAVPYMVSIGNHEYDYPGQPFNPPWGGYGHDSAGECGIPYQKRFHMPGPNTTQGRNLWYSFDYGNVHFLAFSSEHDFTEGSEQLAFIEEDLASVDRTKTPWVIIAAHRPMYCTNVPYNFGPQLPVWLNKNLRAGYPDHNAKSTVGDYQLKTSDDYMRFYIEPLMVKYRVDLALWAHEHNYERTCPLVNFTCVADGQGPTHVIIGMAGNVAQSTYSPSLPNSPAVADSGHHSQPAWSIFRSGNWGFATINTNQTHLHLQYIGDNSGQVHDEVYLTKPDGPKTAVV